MTKKTPKISSVLRKILTTVIFAGVIFIALKKMNPGDSSGEREIFYHVKEIVLENSAVTEMYGDTLSVTNGKSKTVTHYQDRIEGFYSFKVAGKKSTGDIMVNWVKNNNKAVIIKEIFTDPSHGNQIKIWP